jgi:transcriptional regulator with XRE-family HTH domain
MADAQGLHQRIKSKMAEAGMSQRALSRAIGCSPSMVSAMLSNPQQIPDVKNLQLFARVLGCSLAYLLGESEDLNVVDLTASGQPERKLPRLDIQVTGNEAQIKLDGTFSLEDMQKIIAIVSRQG